MLENSIYSVISPEGCASILWRDLNHVKIAAESLKLTAYDCKKFNVIDEIIPELFGGAHRNFLETMKSVGDAISHNLDQLLKMKSEDLQPGGNDLYRAHTMSPFLYFKLMSPRYRSKTCPS